MAQLSPLTKLYQKISDNLSDEDVKSLRTLLVPDVFGVAKVQRASALEIFKMLQADNKIGKGDLGLLVDILKSLGKGRLAEEAEQLEQQQRAEAQEPPSLQVEAAAAMPQTAPMMSEASCTLLQRNYPTIYQELDATRVLDYLHEQGVLTVEMRQEILDIPGRHHRTKRLLDLLQQMDDRAFNIFRTALGHAGYLHLMELLTGGQPQLMPPMPMAMAIYTGLQGSEHVHVSTGELPHGQLNIPNEHLLTTVYQKEQARQLKIKMRDEELKEIYRHQKKQLKIAHKTLSKKSFERKFDQLQAKVEAERAIIVGRYRGCVILFLTFESEPKFEHFWGSCTSGDLSTTLSELLLTEEMRGLEGGDQLVVKTLVLEQDVTAWRDYFKKGDQLISPQPPMDEQVEKMTSGLSSLEPYRQTGSILESPTLTSIKSSLGSIQSLDSGTGSLSILYEGDQEIVRPPMDVQVKKVTSQHIQSSLTSIPSSLGSIQSLDSGAGSLLSLSGEAPSLEPIHVVKEGEEEKAKESQQMEERPRQLTTQEARTRAVAGHVYFQPSSLSLGKFDSIFKSAGFTINVEGPAVESLPCSVTVTANKADVTGGDVAPQIEVTSPQGKTTLIQTTAHTSPPLATGKGLTSRVRRVWGGVWRPQTSGKYSLGVCMGVRKDLGSLTVDVGSNNPVLRFGQKGSQHGQFDWPTDVAVRGDRLYVADYGNQRVQVFDLSGKFCHSFSTTANPESVAVQTDSTIVVKSGKEVKKFSPSGELLHKFPLDEYCTDPYSLAVQRDGRVVVADPGKHSIFLFEADGTLVKQVGGKGQGQFDQPCFVCVDKEDNIIVADTDNHRVQVFDKNLNFKHKFGRWGRQPQDIKGPTGVSADSRGNIVLANTGVEKLQVFRLDGTWLSTISSDGDRLHTPHGVAVTEDGHVFVADPHDNCIRKYRYM
ncbi:uncharacterized protein [Branchiostoma lanceolatum]|uniref:uncharacterized protein n=1 Tax=Branchiostoma lanceolatum TaxID=7740 RepID=UPI003455A9A6